FENWFQPDANGVYDLKRIKLGGYYIQVCGFGPADNGNFICGSTYGRLSNAGEVQQRDINLPGAGTVQGTVRTAEGTPMPDTAVWISAYGNSGQDGGKQYSLRTDIDGNFEHADVPAGPVQVVAYA